MTQDQVHALVELQRDMRDLLYDCERMKHDIATLIARQKERDRKVITDVSGNGQPRQD